MTTKDRTGLLPLTSGATMVGRMHFRARCAVGAMALVQWPWLLKSLYGGTLRQKQALLHRLHLPANALPHLGSWKADTFFLNRILDVIADMRPRTVVELGSGTSSLVIARALSLHGGGSLISYDQHAPFTASMGKWLAEHQLVAEFHHAPLTLAVPKWGGEWYRLGDLPPSIDLLVIDGPPWVVHPLVRGAAEFLFPRIPVGGRLLLDDASRPGERIVASRWRRAWPDFTFRLETGGVKGLLSGERGA